MEPEIETTAEALVPRELKSEVAEIQDKVFMVITAETYPLALEERQRIARAKKALEEIIRPVIAKAHEAHKAAVAVLNRFIEPLNARDAQYHGGIKRYLAEAEAKRLEAEALARAEAKRVADEEAAKKASEMAEAGVDEEEIQQAVAAIPAPVPMPVQNFVPKSSAAAMRDVWKFEITDPMLIPRDYLMVDEKKVRARVNSFKSEAAIPGVRVWCEKDISVRR